MVKMGKIFLSQCAQAKKEGQEVVSPDQIKKPEHS
jgi:hypothetical protein